MPPFLRSFMQGILRVLGAPPIKLGALFIVGIGGGLGFGLLTGMPAKPSLALETTEPPKGALRQNASRMVPGAADRADPVLSDSRLRLGPARINTGPPRAGVAPSGRPRIAIVIDDMGLSEPAFRAVNALPAPLTLSFLPYGEAAQEMIDALSPGHEAMLHLPMEPLDRIGDAGPGMLRVDDDAAGIEAALLGNLAAFSGYSGVNNHTGSRFTADAAAMRVVLDALDERGLYFLDSLTTNEAVAADLAVEGGYAVLERNVFLDPDYRTLTAQSVAIQLAEAEAIAEATGAAIVIGHPYRVTIDALAQWRASAEERGFEIVPVSALLNSDDGAPVEVLTDLR